MRAPRPQLPLLLTHFNADARAPASEVNTPMATSGPLSSPLLLPRPHLSHMQRPAVPGESFLDQGGMCSPAAVQHDAWSMLDLMEEGLNVADMMFEAHQLVWLPGDSQRRGSLPELVPRSATAPVASPGGVPRHALPQRLFGDSS